MPKENNNGVWILLGAIGLVALTFGGVVVEKKLEQSGQFPLVNFKSILESLKKFGITNKYLQAGILSVIAKESGMLPRNESSYSHTSNDRLRKIFGKRISDLTENQLSSLKTNDIAFFDKIYGGRYGNNSPGDGFKYRGRGFNQLTFRDSYKSVGLQIKRDIEHDPDRMLDLDVASDAVSAFYVTAFKAGKASGDLKLRSGLSDANDVKDLPTAVKISIQANAGWKTDPNNFVVQEGLKKSLAYSPEIYKMIA